MTDQKNENETIEVIDNNNSTLIIPINSIRYFGNNIVPEYYKSTGEFKKFNSISWIKDHQNNKYSVDLSIGKLKKYFDNYDSTQIKHRDIKKGKQVTAIEWQCEIIVKNIYKLSPKQFAIVKNAIEAHTWFTLDGKHPFFYLNTKFFKDSKNDRIVYIDTHDNLIVNVDLKIKKQTEALKWEKEYLNSKK